MPDSGQVLFEVRDRVGWITFNRPEARNAMTWAMYQRLRELCAEVSQDKSIRALVLAGAGGKAFVAGTDISQFLEFKEERDVLDYEERINAILNALETVPVPTVAAIQGAAVGGGAGIAAACDLRIGSPSAKIGLPIARTLGNCLSMENYARLASLIGLARLKEMVFTSRLVEAQEALAMGLLNEVTPTEEGFLPRVQELAALLASQAPLTLRATKEALRRIRRGMIPEESADLVLMCYMSRDFKEGVQAFLEKRRPQWRGE
ncbi:MAG: enoyl-CoA hydratase/isomerase family protein [Chloroflexota bacterium]|nr:enoyl-CoA hydratase/isomerase family protein [Chloroflexota bacterium]